MHSLEPAVQTRCACVDQAVGAGGAEVHAELAIEACVRERHPIAQHESAPGKQDPENIQQAGGGNFPKLMAKGETLDAAIPRLPSKRRCSRRPARTETARAGIRRPRSFAAR